MGAADAGLYHPEETLAAHGWAWPCGKEGLPFAGACFENVFIKLHVSGRSSASSDMRTAPSGACAAPGSWPVMR